MRSLNVVNSSLVVLLFSSFLFLNACSSDGDTRPEYLDAATIQNLEIPPQLTLPNTSGAFLLPEPSEKAKQNVAKNGLNAVEVKEIAPEFKGIRLKNDGSLYWLEIDSSIERVWDSLPSFLAAEGIAVERVEKLMGFVDTQWMNEYQVTYGGEEPAGWLAKFFPDFKDKFRLRLEKSAKNVTNLFISHRGMQLAATDDTTQWVQRNSDAMLERELMYRYVLFAGAAEQSATNLLADYKSYQPRVILNKDQLAIFQVQGNESTVWVRLKLAMDRLGVDVVKIDEQARSIEILVGDLKVTPANAEDAGWFSGMFGRDINVDDGDGYVKSAYKKPPVEKHEEKNDKVKLLVVQIADQYVSEIKLENAGEMSGITLEFRDALVNQLN